MKRNAPKGRGVFDLFKSVKTSLTSTFPLYESGDKLLVLLSCPPRSLAVAG